MRMFSEGKPMRTVHFHPISVRLKPALSILCARSSLVNGPSAVRGGRLRMSREKRPTAALTAKSPLLLASSRMRPTPVTSWTCMYFFPHAKSRSFFHSDSCLTVTANLPVLVIAWDQSLSRD